MSNKNINSDDDLMGDKELDHLFNDLKNTKLKKAVKKAKWHSILRNVLISLLVLIVVLIGGSIANRNLNYKLEGPVQISVDNFNNISAPNKYIGKVERYHGTFGGKNVYTTYKLIEGKLVYTGQGEYNYGLFQDYQGNRIGSGSPSILGRSFNAEDIEKQKYNELGQREMIFLYPFIDYPHYRNDLELLDDIGPNKIMEMALSFDQAYNMDKAKELLPSDVTLSWYWIDDLSEQEKKESESFKIEQIDEDGKTYIRNTPAKIRSEKTVYGIKVYNPDGDNYETPFQSFMWALKNGKEYNTRFKGEFERVYNNLIGVDGKLSKEDIKVFGVVVTGDAESLKNLRGLSFIKSSSLGVVTDKY